jgi:hypothetical protein
MGVASAIQEHQNVFYPGSDGGTTRFSIPWAAQCTASCRMAVQVMLGGRVCVFDAEMVEGGVSGLQRRSPIIFPEVNYGNESPISPLRIFPGGACYIGEIWWWSNGLLGIC